MVGPIVSPEQAGVVVTAGRKMPRTPFWDAAPGQSYVQHQRPGPWESVRLAGVDLPGVCFVRSAKGRKSSRTAGPGDEQEAIVDTGAEASDVGITCVMWTPEHLAGWEDLIEAVELKGGTRGDPKAVDVVHPGLNAAGITSLYVLMVTIPERGRVSGTMEFALQATEFRPKAKKAPGGAPKMMIEASTPPIPVAIDPTKPSPRGTESKP